MASVVGLLEERELAARERVEGLREEADRVLAELGEAEIDWESWVIARQRVGEVLSVLPASFAPEETGEPVVALTAPLSAPALVAVAGAVSDDCGESSGSAVVPVAASKGRGPARGSIVPVRRPGLEVGVLAPEYRRIVLLLAERQGEEPDSVMTCQDIAVALGLELTATVVEGAVRSRAKRLVARGWIVEPVAGRFRLPLGLGAGS
jgi:hypothetical protein